MSGNVFFKLQQPKRDETVIEDDTRISNLSLDARTSMRTYFDIGVQRPANV